MMVKSQYDECHMVRQAASRPASDHAIHGLGLMHRDFKVLQRAMTSTRVSSGDTRRNSLFASSVVRKIKRTIASGIQTTTCTTRSMIDRRCGNPACLEFRTKADQTATLLLYVHRFGKLQRRMLVQLLFFGEWTRYRAIQDNLLA
jgi:hypothetical protein